MYDLTHDYDADRKRLETHLDAKGAVRGEPKVVSLQEAVLIVARGKAVNDFCTHVLCKIGDSALITRPMLAECLAEYHHANHTFNDLTVKG